MYHEEIISLLQPGECGAIVFQGGEKYTTPAPNDWVHTHTAVDRGPKKCKKQNVDFFRGDSATGTRITGRRLAVPLYTKRTRRSWQSECLCVAFLSVLVTPSPIFV
jgi:hypothetical protein